MKKWIFAALVITAGAPVATHAAAGDPHEIFAEANKLLESGQTDAALLSYDALIAQGFSGTPLYYNLGNAHYRRGERGKAILWYERARRISPRDADVDFNLSLARSHLKEAQEPPLQRAALYFSTSELGWATTLFSVIFFGLLGAIAMGWLRPEAGARTAAWFSGTALLFAALWFGGNVAWSERRTAIVVSPPGEVRNGPGAEYAVGFTIPEGSKVVILNERSAWSQVGVPEQGLRGWMPSGEVELVSSGWAKSSS